MKISDLQKLDAGMYVITIKGTTTAELDSAWEELDLVMPADIKYVVCTAGAFEFTKLEPGARYCITCDIDDEEEFDEIYDELANIIPADIDFYVLGRPFAIEREN